MLEESEGDGEMGSRGWSVTELGVQLISGNNQGHFQTGEVDRGREEGQC